MQYDPALVTFLYLWTLGCVVGGVILGLAIGLAMGTAGGC
jgi:hypothetical protein